MACSNFKFNIGDRVKVKNSSYFVGIITHRESYEDDDGTDEIGRPIIRSINNYLLKLESGINVWIFEDKLEVV